MADMWGMKGWVDRRPSLWERATSKLLFVTINSVVRCAVVTSTKKADSYTTLFIGAPRVTDAPVLITLNVPKISFSFEH